MPSLEPAACSPSVHQWTYGGLAVTADRTPARYPQEREM
jgi:hypothetical protein